MNKLILLTEVHDIEQKSWSSSGKEKNISLLREIVVNPNHVVLIRENESIKEKLMLTGWPEGLDKRVSFCKVVVNSGSHSANLNVVGDLFMTAQKLGMEA